MPAAPLVFRSCCGCFVPVFMAFMSKRAKEKAAARIAMLTPRNRVDGVTLGLLLTLMFWGGILLRCGDVERNPGPGGNKAGTKQTRLSTIAGSDRRSSTDKTGDSGTAQTTTPSTPDQPTMADLMQMMQSMQLDMNSKFDDTEKRDRDLSGQYTSLQSSMKEVMDEVRVLREENRDLVQKNSELMDRITALEKKTDDLEGRSKRNNLIFYGMHREHNESNEDLESNLRDMLTDKLELSNNVKFDRVHRINSKPDSPVIACCHSYRDKLMLLKCKGKLRGTPVFIGEDFSDRVREVRRKLTPHLKSARGDGRRAIMVFDHLLIDGKKFFLDDRGNLTENR